MKIKKEPTEPSPEVLAAEARAEEYKNDLQRTRADFENFRKQVEIDRERAKKTGVESTILKLLPLLDDMDRAFKSAPEALAPVKKSFDKTLSELGLAKIDAAEGTPFDPDLHDAISMSDEDGDVEVIAEELRPGYTYEGAVIRAAMVRVKRVAGATEEAGAENAAETAEKAGTEGSFEAETSGAETESLEKEEN